jgi:hypothetical protein
MLRFVAEPEVPARVPPIHREESVDPVNAPGPARQPLYVPRTPTRAIASEHHRILLDHRHGSPHFGCYESQVSPGVLARETGPGGLEGLADQTARMLKAGRLDTGWIRGREENELNLF